MSERWEAEVVYGSEDEEGPVEISRWVDDERGGVVYHASLPHQCDSWDIAGSYWDGVGRDEALEKLRWFAASVGGALAAVEALAD